MSIMKKNTYKGGAKFPGSFQTQILMRVMSPEDLEDLQATYESAKEQAGRLLYKPTKQDIQVYKTWLKGDMTIREAMKEMGVKAQATILRRFALIGAAIVNKEIKL